MTVGAGIIHRPIRPAGLPIAIFEEAAEPGSNGGIHQAREDPFAFIPIVGREIELPVFDAWIFAKRFLESV